MVLPNYKNSIVNLLSSITRNFNYPHKYSELSSLTSKELKSSKNVVLIVLDGLGYEYLKKQKNSFLAKNIKSKLTTVFPSATSAAITTFITAEAPKQHAFTGWFLYLKEIGQISLSLPFVSRADKKPITIIDVKDVLSSTSIFEKIKVDSYLIMPSRIINSKFTSNNSKKAKKLGYNTIGGFLSQIKKAINKNKRKYIYAYWPFFDGLSHDFGANSKETLSHFKLLDKKIEEFIKKIQGTNTTVIITADHGLIDTPKKNRINLEDHPKLKECLTLPLCGESKVSYCYVHPSKTAQFEKYVKTKFKKYCELHKSIDLIKKGYFGLFNENEKLLDRIGDYVLIMKDNYILKDKLLNEKKGLHVSHHGGLSKEEMLVPLIVFKI
jgi:predicted AlkP superfamily pyrophosphatase or phosphodiesterase